MTGFLTGAYAVQTMLRVRSEELTVRAEPVLAASVTRTRWVLGHLVHVMAGSCLLVAAAGIAVGLVHGLRTSTVASSTAKVIGGGAPQLPAVFVLAGVAVFLFGFAPRWVAAAWAVLAAAAVLQQLGAILQVDQLLLNLSPYLTSPRSPGSRWTGARS